MRADHLFSAASHWSAHPCLHSTLQHPDRMFSSGVPDQEMVFREWKHLKCVHRGICSTQERVNLWWDIRPWCKSPRTLDSNIVAAAAPAECSPAQAECSPAQAVRAREYYTFGFKDVGLQRLYLPEATHGAMSMLHSSPERGGGARGACLNT